MNEIILFYLTLIDDTSQIIASIQDVMESDTYSDADLVFHASCLLGLFNEKELVLFANENFRKRFVSTMMNRKIDWIGNDPLGSILLDMSSALNVGFPDSTRQTIQAKAAFEFIKRMTESNDRPLDIQLPTLSIANGDLGPANYDGSSCWCDSTIVALFMSTRKTDYILANMVIRSSWNAWDWIEGTPSIIRGKTERDVSSRLKQANALRQNLEDVVTIMRAQKMKDSGETVNLRSKDKEFKNYYYSSVMKKYVKAAVSILGEFGLDLGSSNEFKDSVEILTFLPDILGALEMWNPICRITRSKLFVSMPSAMFEISEEKERGRSRFTYRFKSKTISKKDFSFFTKNGMPFDRELRLEPRISRSVIGRAIISEDVELESKGITDSLTLQGLINRSIGASRATVSVIQPEDRTTLEYLRENGIAVQPVRGDQKLGSIPCVITKDKVDLLTLPEILLFNMGRRGTSEGNMVTTKVGMFDANGHARVKLSQGGRVSTYEVIAASHYKAPHYTSFVRPLNTTTWFLFNDSTGGYHEPHGIFSAVEESTKAQESIETRGYFLVLERIS